MSLPIRLLPEAKVEFDAAADWYELQRAGLGVDFVARVRAVLNRIAANPQMYSAVSREGAPPGSRMRVWVFDRHPFSRRRSVEVAVA